MRVEYNYRKVIDLISELNLQIMLIDSNNCTIKEKAMDELDALGEMLARVNSSAFAKESR